MEKVMFMFYAFIAVSPFIVVWAFGFPFERSPAYGFATMLSICLLFVCAE